VYLSVLIFVVMSFRARYYATLN